MPPTNLAGHADWQIGSNPAIGKTLYVRSTAAAQAPILSLHVLRHGSSISFLAGLG